MKNIFICLLAVVLLSNGLFAQDIFVKHYGDFSGQGSSVVVDPQGNIFLAGNRSQGVNLQQQFCVYKINPVGDTLWLKHYGGYLNDYANKIISTIDGGFALIGYSTTGNSDSRITFVKIQSSGNLTWIKTIGGLAQEQGTSIVQTPVGEYFIGGSKKNANSMFDFYLLKTDMNGDTMWSMSYGGNLDDVLNSIDLCSDGGIIMTGYTESYGAGSRDFYLIKVDNAGNVQWTKTYGSTLADYANSVKQTSDGGYILAGSVDYAPSPGTIFVVKTNSTGDTVWTRKFGGTGESMAANDIIVTQDGGYAIAGSIYLLTPNGGYSSGNVYLLKLANNGSLKASKQYNLDPSKSCGIIGYGNSIIQLSDGSCVVGGSYFNCSTFETLLIKTFDIGPTAIKQQEIGEIKLFPNPSNDKIALQFNDAQDDYSLSLFDLNGILVSSKEYVSTNRVTIEKGSLSRGIYFFQLKNHSGKTNFGKIVFE